MHIRSKIVMQFPVNLGPYSWMLQNNEKWVEKEAHAIGEYLSKSAVCTAHDAPLSYAGLHALVLPYLKEYLLNARNRSWNYSEQKDAEDGYCPQSHGGNPLHINLILYRASVCTCECACLCMCVCAHMHMHMHMCLW